MYVPFTSGKFCLGPDVGRQGRWPALFWLRSLLVLRVWLNFRAVNVNALVGKGWVLKVVKVGRG